MLVRTLRAYVVCPDRQARWAVDFTRARGLFKMQVGLLESPAGRRQQRERAKDRPQVSPGKRRLQPLNFSEQYSFSRKRKTGRTLIDPFIRFPYNCPMASDQLILQGHATDQVWAMRSPTGTIGLCLDDGGAGTVYLTADQARAVIETLGKMLR
jgi:hypothetical protein